MSIYLLLANADIQIHKQSLAICRVSSTSRAGCNGGGPSPAPGGWPSGWTDSRLNSEADRAERRGAGRATARGAHSR